MNATIDSFDVSFKKARVEKCMSPSMIWFHQNLYSYVHVHSYDRLISVNILCYIGLELSKH